MTNEYLEHVARELTYEPLFPPGFNYLDLGRLRRGEPFATREDFVTTYAWAIPSDEAIAALAELSPLVEMGAGGGYWAHLLREAGADVVAYDRKHLAVTRPYGLRKVWYPVARGGPRKLARHPDRTLFLCWPPYDNWRDEDDEHPRFSVECLRYYAGGRVAYVGEYEGGCTACDQFFYRLASDFELEREVRLPQYMGIRDGLSIWRRCR